jgi:hypothetical protein
MWAHPEAIRVEISENKSDSRCSFWNVNVSLDGENPEQVAAASGPQTAPPTGHPPLRASVWGRLRTGKIREAAGNREACFQTDGVSHQFLTIPWE